MVVKIQIAIAGALIVFGLSCVPAKAYHLIPYRLKMGSGATQERYSVWVSLPDSMEGILPVQDDLARTLAVRRFHYNSPPSPSSIFTKLASRAFSWYLDQRRANRRLYGEHAEEIARKVEESVEPIDPDTSSLIIVTQYHRPTEPVAFLRIRYPDAKGLLPIDSLRRTSQARMDDGEGGEQRRVVIPRFDFNAAGVLDLTDTPADRMEWKGGGRIELQHFSFLPSAMRKFFPPLYFTARAHRLFAVMPPVGKSSLTSVDYLALDCYMSGVRDFYEALGFSIEETYQVPLQKGELVDYHIMGGKLDYVDERVFELNRTLFSRPNSPGRKLYLSRVGGVFGCGGEVAEKATP